MQKAGFLVGAFAFLAPVAAHSQDSVSLVLRGYVPERSSLHLLEANLLVSSDLRSSVKDALVARFRETSNSISGYTIKVLSESAQRDSGPHLTNRQNGTRVPYVLSYGGRRLEFAGGEAGIKRPRRAVGERSVESALTLSAEGSERIPSGEYVDTITVAISAR